MRKASRYFKVHHTNVIRWKKERVAKVKNPGKRQHKKGQGRNLSYPKEIEEKLVCWILEKREADCVAITTQLIRCKALSLIRPITPTFKASDGWVRKFMERNNLVLRCKTHVSQTLPKDLEEKISSFRNEVASVFQDGDYPLDYICNMDETPIYLDLLPSKVVDRKGKKTIPVRTTASEKNRVTATLACTASGKMLPPFVVFKGKTKRTLKKLNVPKGVVCTTQPKAWMDEERMLEWIDEVWKPYVRGRPALLSLDTFTAHLTEAVKDSFHKCHTKLLIIPGGCTSILQPLDVSVNKPFKSYIRQSWCERMVKEAETGTAKVTPASETTLMEWVKEAADRVEQHPTTIEKSFRVTGIVPDPVCTRNDTVHQEIQEVMLSVFGEEHMGYVEPTDDPFRDSDVSSDSDDSSSLPKPSSIDQLQDPFRDSGDSSDGEDSSCQFKTLSSDRPQESDPFHECSDIEYSEMEYSDIDSDVEFSDMN